MTVWLEEGLRRHGWKKCDWMSSNRGWTKSKEEKGWSNECEREDEGEVDEKLPSPVEGLASTMTGLCAGDWDAEIRVGLAGFIGEM